MKKYSEEVKAFIADNVQGITEKDLAILVNAKFGLDFTESKNKFVQEKSQIKKRPLRNPNWKTIRKIP